MGINSPKNKFLGKKGLEFGGENEPIQAAISLIFQQMR
jgi:hypothetical protein